MNTLPMEGWLLAQADQEELKEVERYTASILHYVQSREGRYRIAAREYLGRLDAIADKLSRS